jgi:CheY-like chemotaxis protein
MNPDFSILLADDNENDIDLVRGALESMGVEDPIHVVRDGAQAMAYLRGDANYVDRQHFPFPHLLLLDIKMPKVNGLEVLEWIRHQPDARLRRLPVIMMSNSDITEDIDRAYGLGVNAYVVKPYEFDELLKVLRTTTEFWKEVAAHPGA